MTIYSGLYYQAGEGDAFMESQPITWFIFAAVLIPSLIFAVNFGRQMWSEILKVVVIKSPKIFRFITCGSKDVTQFRLENLDQSESEDEGVELAPAPPNAASLQGFNQAVAKQNPLAERIAKSRRAKFLRELEEQE